MLRSRRTQLRMAVPRPFERIPQAPLLPVSWWGTKVGGECPWGRFWSTLCTALVVGSDDVASRYSIGVLTRRQVGRREGSRGAREVASY